MADLSPIWNQKLLIPPPICNLKIEVTVKNIDKLKSLKQILEKCLTVLDDDTAISSEIFILSRLIYKRNLQLRREKTMKFLKQIEKCMKRYIEMDIKKLIVDFKKSFDEYDTFFLKKAWKKSLVV
ncbi:hypothetical protein LOTGIDRAFT_168725 [Lottia gigantea]|uniref:Nucleolus and neural progenitor protein-like N-terminal domain-containing protein n=1 Tax=Lottia gigantea TaxID=225164 RepID=V4B7D7_LOTGI|nr:hypothetical protein LOTGIDRAFT_168725 [Lottia gigantea]ESO84494.1 hypothetical protein LOTGIDRAFT_168725 [Lottia gigantea]